jgi:hypothetical protein
MAPPPSSVEIHPAVNPFDFFSTRDISSRSGLFQTSGFSQTEML